MKHKNGIYPWINGAIIIGGTLLRLIPLFSFSFSTPFHLGGLFYQFSQQILTNHFRLPQTIPYYSMDGIPFLYPPLAFYIQSVIIKLFHPPAFLTVNLLPVLFSILTLPAFYWMIIYQVENHGLQSLALFAYAFMPSAFINQIEAAGLAEACGSIFLLLLLGTLFQLEKNQKPLLMVLAGISLGLSVLSSPGSAYGAAIIGSLFFLKEMWLGIRNRSYRRPLWLFGSGVIGLIVASPWLATIIGRGDLARLAGTFLHEQSGNSFANQIRYMVTFKPADMVTFIGDEGVFGFLFDWLIFGGLIWAVLNRSTLQPALFLILWLIPREGCWLVAIPSALLAAWGGVNLLWPMIRSALAKSGNGTRMPIIPGALIVILGLVSIFGGLMAVNTLKSQIQMTITTASIHSLEEAKTIIPGDAQVLVIGNPALREWTPALLQRDVLNCEFGSEWKPEIQSQVEKLNNALSNKNLEESTRIIRETTGDAIVWFVADPDSFRQIMPSQGLSLRISDVTYLDGLVIGTISLIN